jgi:hypothetical protein
LATVFKRRVVDFLGMYIDLTNVCNGMSGQE